MTLDDVKKVLGAALQDPALVGTIHGDGRVEVVWCNAALTDLTGYTAVDLSGGTGAGGLGLAPDADPSLRRRLSAALRAGRPISETVPCLRKDGTRFRGALQMRPLCLHDAAAPRATTGGAGTGAPAADERRHWVAIVRDISDEIALREALDKAGDEAERARSRLWSAIEALPDAFVLYDSDDRLVVCNARYLEFYPESAPAMIPGAAFRDIIRYGLANGQYPDAVGREEAWFAERMRRHQNPGTKVEQRLSDGRYLQIHEVRTEIGDTVGFRIDVTALKRQQQALEDQARALARSVAQVEAAANTDALTGLANRRGLDRYLADLADGTAVTQAAYLHIDLDRFKQINDMFGHAAGDHVLQSVADILRESVRPGDLIARVGGDEFAIVVQAERAEEVGLEIAHRVIAACRAPVLYDGKPCHFGASIGISVRAPGEPVTGLMENADIALYEAKGEGRNRAAIFNARLRDEAEARKQLADDLLQALDRNEIRAWFQPQVDARDGRLAGVEALARWHHPRRGVLAPAEFLRIADDLDVTARIDAAVLRLCLDLARDMAERGRPVPKVSVNVGFRRLTRAGLIGELDRAGPLPCRVAVELLETIDFDGSTEAILWEVDTLRDRGCEIEIDDFGSGHASISTLLKLRPHRIKIDRKLVAAVTSEQTGASPLVRAIGDMAAALDIRLTAEGVETEVQAQVLRNLGCDVFQGFLFAPPLSRDGFVRYALRNHPAPADTG